MSEAISTRAIAAFKSARGICYPYAEVWHKINGKTATLQLATAAVTYDMNAGSPRSCSISVAGFKGIVPDASGLAYKGTMADTNGIMGDGIMGDYINRELRGLLVAGPNQIRLFLKMLYEDGTFENINMGRFEIAKPSFRHSATTGVVATVVGYDVTWKVKGAGYSKPYNITAGTNVRTALMAHLTSVLPGVSVVAPASTYLTPGLTFLPVEGANALSDAQELAYSGGWKISSGRGGTVVAEAPKDPGTGTPIWEVNPTRIVSLDMEQDVEDAVNILVVTGQDPDGNEVYGSAEHTQGPFGTIQLGPRRKVISSEFVTSTTQAGIMAQARLPEFLGFVDRLSVEIAFAPHLDHGDLIGITDEEMQLSGTVYLIEIANHDLATKTTSLVVSRRIA